MRATKCDLSYNHAKLDYEAMLTTAQIAVYHTLEEIRLLSGKMRIAMQEKDISSIYLDAQWLEGKAKQLTVAAEVLATLIGGQEREEIEIVNHRVTKDIFTD